MNLIIATGFFSFLFSSPSGVANKAEDWEGKHYNKGVTAQCAAFVGHVVKQSGKTPPVEDQKCTNWLKWGKPVNKANLRRGDIIIYARSGKYHHISIYLGDGYAMHRPTRSKTVRKIKYNYRSIIAIRRP